MDSLSPAASFQFFLETLQPSEHLFGGDLTKQKWSSDPFVPRVLQIATVHLSAHLNEVGLFRKPSKKVDLDALKVEFENDLETSLEGTNLRCVADLLKTWLRELSQPIITPFVCEKLESTFQDKSLKEPEFANTLLDACLFLPQENLIVLKFLLKFLHERIVKDFDVNTFAVLMAPNLFPYKFCQVTIDKHISILEILIANANLLDNSYSDNKKAPNLLETFHIFDKQNGSYEALVKLKADYLAKNPDVHKSGGLKRKGEISDEVPAAKKFHMIPSLPLINYWLNVFSNFGKKKDKHL